MKIIKKSTKVEVFRGKCYNCKSVVEADRKELDMTYDQREQYELGSGNCPSCGTIMGFYLRIQYIEEPSEGSLRDKT